MPNGTRTTPLRAALGLVALAGLLAACDRDASEGGASPGNSVAGASTGFSVDGVEGNWTIDPGSVEQAADADAQFNRYGVATTVRLRARDGQQVIELYGVFQRDASDPMFQTLRVSYDDGQGTVFKHSGDLAPQLEGQPVEGFAWQRLELDQQAGVGHATVRVQVPACADVYSGPTESEKVCHQIEGSFDTAMVHYSKLSPFE